MLKLSKVEFLDAKIFLVMSRATQLVEEEPDKAEDGKTATSPEESQTYTWMIMNLIIEFDNDDLTIMVNIINLNNNN